MGDDSSAVLKALQAGGSETIVSQQNRSRREPNTTLYCLACDSKLNVKAIDEDLLHNWPICCNRPMRIKE